MTSQAQRPRIRRDRETSPVSRLRGRDRNDPITFFTIAEVAEALRVSTPTVRRWIEAGDLVTHRLGGSIRIGGQDLRTFLALRREGWQGELESTNVHRSQHIGSHRDYFISIH